MDNEFRFANENEVERAVALISELGITAESELDVIMFNCGILVQIKAGCAVDIPKENVLIEQVSREWKPVEASSDFVVALQEAAAHSHTQFDIVLFGVPATLLMMLDCETMRFNADCVFGGYLPPYAERDERAKVVRAWCEAVTRLGILLGADRVECDVMDAPNPVVLWERPAD